MLTRRQMLLASGAALVPACTRWPSLLAADTPKSPTLVFTDGKGPDDARLGTPKTLDDYFPFTPPKTKEEWAARRQRVREQVLVAEGLWPLPEKTPLTPTIHGKIERDGYTVEKVFFASTPGHYVCGNLYRPTAKDDAETAKHPAILCPHGHWKNGRLYENADAGVEAEIKRGAEKTKEGAKYPLQARSAQLARMGFVVFFYDMVGYADSTAIPHILKSGVPNPDGFADADGELRLQSLMGLQTWNSVRALDFLETLPDVDKTKIGITGASGGGTQTFILAAIDDRVQAAFPAVMVSTAMQGGCVCENCSLLRVNTGNIELAAAFAPKPLAMSGADDWTKEIMTKGYPELKRLYKLLGAEGNVLAKAWTEHPHNYNQLAREMMYGWFAKHLLGKDGAVAEHPFKPVPPADLRVFDDAHPRPKDELGAKELRKKLTDASDKQMAALAPTDAKSLAAFKALIGTAVRAMVCDELPKEIAVRSGPLESKHDGFTMHRAVLGRADEKDAVPHAGVIGPKHDGGKVAVWVHPDGKASLFDGAKLAPAVQKLVDAGFAVVAPDVLGVGELPLPKGFPVSGVYAAFTYGYNRSLAAARVHDILTSIAFARTMKAKAIHLAGFGGFGPLAVLAKVLAGDAVAKLAADLNQFRFETITKTDDPMLLPGAVKYGGLPAFLAACAPAEVLAYNHRGTATGKLPKAAYDAADAADKLVREEGAMDPAKVAEWLMS